MGAVPITAHAQYVPPWLVVSALSPLVMIVLCIVMGVVTSYFVENDYVIWSTLVLYGGHSLIIIILIPLRGIGRMVSRRPKPHLESRSINL